MSKDKITRIILSIIFIAVAVGVVGLYAWEVIYNDVPAGKNIFRTLATVCICISGLIKIKNGGRRQSLPSAPEQPRPR